MVGGRPCRFSMIEFKLIIGLKMGPHVASADNVNQSTWVSCMNIL